jgi:hypothetical protein
MRQFTNEEKTVSAETLGSFLSQRRLRLGYKSQRQFAIAAVIDPAYYGRLESANQLGSQESWVDVAKGLKIRPGIMLDLFADELTVEQALELCEKEDKYGSEFKHTSKILELPDVLKSIDREYLQDLISDLEKIRNVEHNASIIAEVARQVEFEDELIEKEEELEQRNKQQERIMNERKVS